MFEHTVFSASFSLMALSIAFCQKYFIGNFYLSDGARILILSAFALIGARNFAMGFNRLCDRDIDKENPRTRHRPSVDGRLNVALLIGFCFANACLFVGVSFFINHLAFYLSFPFLIFLGFYSLCKRFSVFAHFVLGLCLGLAPIASAIAVLGEIPLWSINLALGVAFWVAGFDLLYSLQDLDFDRQKKLFSIPAKFGEIKTLYISRLSHLLAVFFWAIFLYQVDAGFFGFLGLIVSIAMLCYEQFLVAKDLNNIPKAFFVTNGYLGFIFLIFILIDIFVRIFYASVG